MKTRSTPSKKLPRARSTKLPERILVAVDAGTLSDHAIRAALELAEEFGAQIELVHAFGSPAMLWQPTPDPREVATERDPLTLATRIVVAHVGKVIGSANGGMKRAESLVRVIPGRPAEVILDRARKQKCDLIVLGALRREPAVDFGGTARAILAGAPCPVWVQPGPRRPIKRILVPVDLSDESFVALETACDMARVTKATITALNVFDLPRLAAVPWDGYGAVLDLEHMRDAATEAFEKAMAQHDWQRVPHELKFVDGSPQEEILKRVPRADLVVMGTHGRTGFSGLLLGSVAYEVLKRTTRPLMVVRKPGRKFAT